jgi:putative DNA primase/helicase
MENMIKGERDILPFEGISCCLLNTKNKTPLSSGWQNGMLYEDALQANQYRGINVGLLLGSKSGIVDIDCDSPEAVKAMRLLADEYAATFSRSSNSSHYLYRCVENVKTVQLTDPDGGVLIELRGDGAQTMIPPSVHPEGDKLYFSKIDAEAGTVTADKLNRLVHMAGVVSLLARVWNKGNRHNLSLALAGLCQSLGIQEVDAQDVIQTVCNVASDEEAESRSNSVQTTFSRPEHQNAGHSALVDLIGEKRTAKIKEWLLKTFGVEECSVVAVNTDFSVMGTSLWQREEEITEVSLAETFAQHINDRALYCVDTKSWYLWNGVRWEGDKRQHISLLSRRLVQHFAKLALKDGNVHLVKRLSSLSDVSAYGTN